ncbi:hypothetical protein RMSM_07343 [Rhodopirellula maiorica SM1]|uniref:Uncharacterized protein n=1 Tax=Rhodopirellula maiorica SM1 TaxID=1265738 RepID=M5R9K8_9BACT|nr:hypothetical protein RMSM_07343 [Rhodopirellula maiorica SM1]
MLAVVSRQLTCETLAKRIARRREFRSRRVILRDFVAPQPPELK